MEKVIAIITQNGILSDGIQHNTKVTLFKLYNGDIIEVENVVLEETNNNYFSVLMISKNVSILYLGTISTELKNTLDSLGIRSKCKDELLNDQFINKFAIER